MRKYFKSTTSFGELTIEIDTINNGWKNNIFIENVMFSNGYDFNDEDRYEYLYLKSVIEEILNNVSDSYYDLGMVINDFSNDKYFFKLDGSNGVELVDYIKTSNIYDKTFMIEEIVVPVKITEKSLRMN